MNPINVTPYTGVPSRGNAQQTVKENSGKIAAGGAVGAATFATIKNSTKVGNRIVQTVKTSQAIKAANKAKILQVFSKFKFFKNPIVQKAAGPLAAFASLSAVVGSVAKIADTCDYLTDKR